MYGFKGVWNLPDVKSSELLENDGKSVLIDDIVLEMWLVECSPR